MDEIFLPDYTPMFSGRIFELVPNEDVQKLEASSEKYSPDSTNASLFTGQGVNLYSLRLLV
jgi:hypothetical protein